MAANETLLITIESPDFACDDLRVVSFQGTETIGRLYEFELEVLCTRHDGPDPDAMLGGNVTLVIDRLTADRGRRDARRVHGVAVEVDDLLASHADQRAYRMRIAPRVHVLGMVETQEIFMDLGVPDIIRQKLAQVELTSASDIRLTGSYAKREFIVEYRESDLQFVSRLAEHLGISFYFEHGDAEEKIVFSDHAAGFGELTEPLGFDARGEKTSIYQLEAKRRMVPSYYATRDYNYRVPLLDLTGEHELKDGHMGGVVEFGTHHKTPEEGAALAKVRAEERQATQLVYHGKSVVPALWAGRRITIADHPDLGTVQLLVTEVKHRATQRLDASGEQVDYVNEFRAIPADRTFRPPRTTPRPRIAGLVTGIVDGGALGPGAKYAQIDEQGRYTVRFLFETPSSTERKASRPVRMLQNHVGEGYGTHYPLKPGVEVLIGFVDGDPDRPVIVGAAPNPIKPSPVNNANPGVHRVKTSTGITVDMAE